MDTTTQEIFENHCEDIHGNKYEEHSETSSCCRCLFLSHAGLSLVKTDIARDSREISFSPCSEERLRDHQFSDQEMSPPRAMTMAAHQGPEDNEDHKEAQVEVKDDEKPPLEDNLADDTVSSDDMVITGHVNSTSYMEEQLAAKGEKEKNKGKKKKKPKSQKLHDSYHVLEDGFLVGSAKILKECREGTNAGDVWIISKTPESSSLNTTAETDPEVAKTQKPRYCLFCNYQDIIKGCGAARVLEYDGDVLVINTTQQERDQLAPDTLAPETRGPLAADEEEEEDWLQAIQRQLEEYNSSSPPSSGKPGVIWERTANVIYFISRSQGPGRPGQEGRGGRQEQELGVNEPYFIEVQWRLKVRENAKIMPEHEYYYPNSELFEIEFDILCTMSMKLYLGKINPTFTTASTDFTRVSFEGEKTLFLLL